MKLIKIEDHKQECMWDIEVESTHNFMANGVLVHNSNGSCCFTPQDDIWFQSRERILSYEADNAGFYTWGMGLQAAWKMIYHTIAHDLQLAHKAMYIYGEWCCGSIQKGIALNLIPEKKFGVFDIVLVDANDKEIHIDPVQYHDLMNTIINNVFVIDAVVPPVEIEIDFTNPSAVQNKLLELTNAVEQECPIGKYFGVSGIGEGLVFSAVDNDDCPKFKCKGTLHSASKVKTVRELTDAEIASKENALEFVQYACTENRLNQGIAKLGEMGLDVDIKNLGAFLQFIGRDILNEEKDVLLKSGIERKDVMPRIADIARNWYINYLDGTLGLNVGYSRK